MLPSRCWNPKSNERVENTSQRGRRRIRRRKRRNHCNSNQTRTMRESRSSHPCFNLLNEDLQMINGKRRKTAGVIAFDFKPIPPPSCNHRISAACLMLPRIYQRDQVNIRVFSRERSKNVFAVLIKLQMMWFLRNRENATC